MDSARLTRRRLLGGAGLVAASPLLPEMATAAADSMPMAERISGPSGFYPKMRPPNQPLEVVDLRSDSVPGRVAALALQGLVNRRHARVYVLARDTDRALLDSTAAPYLDLAPLPGPDAALRTLFKRYAGSRNVVKTMIVYDPARDWTFNLALMIGALEDGIPVTADLCGRLGAEFGWDGRTRDVRAGWPDRLSAYRWARRALMPRLNKQVLFSQGYGGLSIFDYVVATKSFMFWLDNHDPAELAEIEAICRTSGYPTIAPLMGYGYHGDDLVDDVVQFGFGWTVSNFFANASVWSSFPTKDYRQVRGAAVTPEAGRIYVSLIWSDGDNIQFDQQPTVDLWNEPERGLVPVGTTLEPGLREIASPILDWYYAHQTENDELMCGPNGWQFIHNDLYPADRYAEWLDRNKAWNAAAGFHVAATDGTLGSARNNAFLADGGLDGAFLYNGGSQTPYYHGGAVEIANIKFAVKFGDIYSALSAMEPSVSAPTFCYVWIIQAPYGLDATGAAIGYRNIKAEVDRLNTEFPGRFEFLTPSSLIATARLGRP